MTQIAVLGPETFALGFRLAGVSRIQAAETPEELEKGARAFLKDSDISILVMATRDLSRIEPRLRDTLVTSVRPTLVAVGEEEDNTLREKIKQAVGVDLW